MAGNEIPVINTKTGAPQSSGASTSLLNAFYVFKYSGGVQQITAENYTTNAITRHGAAPKVISNPTANAIVEWSKTLPETTENLYGLKDSPYTWSDFLFCKWYGIIPNNRLLTLRKFPLAVNDAASVKRADNPQNVPIAQAVTWFGGPSGNDLNSIWQNTWELAWKKDTVDAKNVQGNEIVNFTQQLANALPEGTDKFVKQAVSTLSAVVDAKSTAGGKSKDELRKDWILSVGKGEIEKMKQDFQKSLFTDTGAFWNQINGPVNVKNTFLIRDRGLSSRAVDDNWKLVFEYRTDSYFGMSQRRIALDIIANMLELTYSSGEWLQSLNIYYKNIGLELGADDQALIEGCFVDGTLNAEELAKNFIKIAETKVDGIIQEAIKLSAAAGKALANGVFQGGAAILQGSGKVDWNLYNGMSDAQKGTLKDAIQIELIKALAGAFPKFVQQRANVADIETGNWHLTVGNPMNPIMRIGSLIVRSCVMEFGEELGPDDFPIEMKFTVTLSPTRPRDSRDIRQTFNTGRIDYVESYIGHTYDQSNTYGVINSRHSAISSGNGGQANIKNQQASTNPAHDSIRNWINTRYGTNTVKENDKFFNDVYFYVPKDSETYGPAFGGNAKTTPTNT